MNNDNDTTAADAPRAAGSSFRDEFWEVEEFAQAIDREVATIWAWWRSGGGPPYARLGSRRVIPKVGGREWLLSRTVTPPRSRKAS